MGSKVIDIMNEKMKEGTPFFSFEYFPPKTDEGLKNLFERMKRMVALGPNFCDITWGAGGSTAELTLEIAGRMQNEVKAECMMHLTCTNMPEAKLAEAMDFLKKAGVKNILALRGDPPHGQDKFEAVDGGFSCALDLIKYIRKETGAPLPPRRRRRRRRRLLRAWLRACKACEAAWLAPLDCSITHRSIV